MSDFDPTQVPKQGPKQVPGPNDDPSEPPEAALPLLGPPDITEEPPRSVAGPDWFVYGGYDDKLKEKERIPYVPGVTVLAEGQLPQPPAGKRNSYLGPLPSDVADVWGHGKTDATGLPAENTARALIGCWGIERFRASALHQLAVQESTREGRMAPLRKAFVEAYAKKGKA